MMRFGISSYTYTWAVGVLGHIPAQPLHVAGLLSKAAQLGVQCLQIADNLPLHTLSIEELNALRYQAIAAGIVIEVGTRGLTPANLHTYTEIASVLQSPFLRMVVDEKDYHPTVNDIVAVIKDYLPELQKKNIKLAIENHDRFTARIFAEIIQKTGSSSVGICLDSVNSMGAGEGIETVVSILGPLTINLHVKDFTVKRVSHMMGFVVEGTPAGKGMLGVESILEQLSHFNRCESAILELWTPPEQQIDQTIAKEDAWAKESVTYLRPFFPL
jgi:sugar phosphate isomerase/epimerase